MIYRAVIDWIRFDIKTSKPMPAKAIKTAAEGALKAHHLTVKTVGANAQGESCCFTLAVQDFQRFSDLVQLESRLGVSCGVISTLIDGVEVSIDRYCNDPAGDLARFYGSLDSPIEGRRRAYHQGGGKFAPDTFDEIKQHFEDGWVIGIGDRNKGDRYMRFYVKDSDTINKQRVAVERRARAEIRLQGEALPSSALNAWHNFKFEDLAEYFHRSRERPNVTDADRFKQIERSMMIDDCGDSNGRQRRSYTHQSDPDNKKVRDALRELSRRWRATARPGRPAKQRVCVGERTSAGE